MVENYGGVFLLQTSKTKKLIKIIDKNLDFIWFLLLPILNLNYILAGRLYEKGLDISISLDNILPLIPIFILPYIYWYVYVPVGFIKFHKTDRQLYMKLFLMLIIGMCTSYIIYYFFPTQYPRPTINDGGILNYLINKIYSADKPFNCFPSLHVYVTYLVMRFTPLKGNKKYFIYTQVTGILIILSTLFVKQHFILDIVGSMAILEVLNILFKFIPDWFIEKLLSAPANLISFLLPVENENTIAK